MKELIQKFKAVPTGSQVFVELSDNDINDYDFNDPLNVEINIEESEENFKNKLEED